MRWDLTTRQEAIRLFDLGFGYKAVGAQLGCPPATVRKWLCTFKVGGKEALLMREQRSYSQELKPGSRSLIRKKRYDSYRGKGGGVAANILDRDFASHRPVARLVTDVTEFKVVGGCVSLAGPRLVQQRGPAVGRVALAGHGAGRRDDKGP